MPLNCGANHIHSGQLHQGEKQMARHKTNKRKERGLGSMKEKGLGLCALGVGALVLPCS